MEVMEIRELELKMAMFGIGVKTINEFKRNQSGKISIINFFEKY